MTFRPHHGRQIDWPSHVAATFTADTAHCKRFHMLAGEIGE
jgi:hypothetical protein